MAIFVLEEIMPNVSRHNMTTMAKLPDFETDDEFFEFVETHDMADYWDEFEET